MNADILREKQRLDHIFELADELQDEEALAHWSRYLCILVSGFVENAVRSLVAAYVERRSHRNVSSYVKTSARSLTNLNEEKLAQLLGKFCPAWRDVFRQRLTDEQKDALDSIVTNKNRIAHGGPDSISLVRVRDYYRRIVPVIQLIESECLGT
jgi:hypothetical protein